MLKSISVIGAVMPALLLNSYLGAAQTAMFVKKPMTNTTNTYYVSDREPLVRQSFAKLPLTAIKPGGWLKKQLELQRDGLTGNLGEISIWLTKTDNAWLNKSRTGKYGWEELPYWLKGYGDIAYILQDKQMLATTKFWINAVLKNQRPDGDFGPVIYKGDGKRDLWAN